MAVRALMDAELVDAMVRARRLASRCQAEELAAVAELARRRFAESESESFAVVSAREYVYDEVASALTLTSRSADELISFATGLREHLPRTFEALAAGRIDQAKARTLWHGTLLLDPKLITRIEADVLPKAPEQTTGQIRAKIRRLIRTLDPTNAKHRNEQAKRQRRLELLDDEHDTACLAGCALPADAASAAFNRINAIATALKTNGDHRRIPQLRADVFLNLLRGTQPPTPTQTTNNPPLTNPTPKTTQPTLTPTAPAMPAEAGERVTAARTVTNNLGGTARANAITARPKDDGDYGSVDRLCADAAITARPKDDGDDGSADQLRADAAIAAGLNDDGDQGNVDQLRAGAGERVTAARTVADHLGGTAHLNAVTARPKDDGDDGSADQLRADAAIAAGLNGDGDDGSVDRLCADALLALGRGIPPPVQPSSPAQVIEQPAAAEPITGLVADLTADTARTAFASVSGSGDIARAALAVADTRLLAEAEERVAATLAVADSIGDMARAALADADAALLAEAGERIAAALRDLKAPACAGGHRYRPPAAMRRAVERRDGRCRFPGCRRPAPRCDLDHTTAHHRGGATCPCNLAALCRRHHRLKQTNHWRLIHLWPGVLLWITPTGHWKIVTPADRE